ncbi:MAG: ATP-binding protein [Actinomycetota bacterium]|nr:ATP-binding protein [Actinomycetota bacterium]
MDAHVRLPSSTERDLAALAFQQLDEPLAVVRLEDGLILEANARFEDISGILGGIVGRSSFALGFWSDVGGVEAVRARLSETGSIESFHAYLRAGREPGRAIRLSAHVLKGVEVPYLLLRAPGNKEEIDPRYLEVREAELREADRLKNTLLNTLSHDVRNPLTSILGIASMLQRDDVELSEDERLELLGTIERSGRKIKQLLTDLLDLDRLENRALTLHREQTDVAELIGDLVLESEMLEERQVGVEASRLDAVDVDPTALGRILDNLLVNAARHTPARTHLWIRAEATEEGLLVAVEDEGPGVPDERKEVVFEPFRRGDDPSVPGTGVGLSLVKRFAELHGGRAWVEDRPGGGASFRVLLP